MLIGGIYREHQNIHQDIPSDSHSDENQLLRWTRFIEKWKTAATICDITVLGDTNLDFLRWGAPPQRTKKMVDNTKAEIETIGFHQLVVGTTRSWADQLDSCLDKVWMNSPGRLVYYINVKRTFSDHNLIVLAFRTKDKLTNKHEIIRRDRKNFNVENYTRKLSQIDWTGFF